MKRILTLIAALTILVFAAGCSLSGGTGTDRPAMNNSSKAMKVTVVKFRNRIWRKNLRRIRGGTEEEETLTVMVYFGDFQSEKVAPETRTVKVKAGTALKR